MYIGYIDMTLTPNINPPALYFSSNKSLVVAELHLGVGLLPSSTILADSIFEACIADLNMLRDKFNAKRLIINGDLKESIGQPSKYELTLLRRFEKYTNDYFDEVILVKGNHDGLINNYINFKITSNYSFVEDNMNINIQHGHTIKIKSGLLVLGHLHPSVRLPDSSTLFVWVFLTRKGTSRENQFNKVIIMPPFNKFVGGGPINSNSLFKRLGFNTKDWDSEIIGVNGVFFGALESFVSVH